MIFSSQSLKKLASEQQRIVRAHWEWAGGYALFWIIVTVLIFGGIFLVMDQFDVDDNVQTQSLILLATVTFWRIGCTHRIDVDRTRSRQAQELICISATLQVDKRRVTLTSH
jgi:hypothetical protein